MRSLPECHWRGGGPCYGYTCLSPIVGPGKHVTAQDCLDCAVINHFSVPQKSPGGPAAIIDQPLAVALAVETKVAQPAPPKQETAAASPKGPVPAVIEKAAAARKRPRR